MLHLVSHEWRLQKLSFRTSVIGSINIIFVHFAHAWSDSATHKYSTINSHLPSWQHQFKDFLLTHPVHLQGHERLCSECTCNNNAILMLEQYYCSVRHHCQCVRLWLSSLPLAQKDLGHVGLDVDIVNMPAQLLALCGHVFAYPARETFTLTQTNPLQHDRYICRSQYLYLQFARIDIHGVPRLL